MSNSLNSLLPTGMNFVIGAGFIIVIVIVLLVLTVMREILVSKGYPFFKNRIRGTVAAFALLAVAIPVIVVVVGEIGRQMAPVAKATLEYLEK